jgi:hypothetical protein
MKYSLPFERFIPAKRWMLQPPDSVWGTGSTTRRLKDYWITRFRFKPPSKPPSKPATRARNRRGRSPMRSAQRCGGTKHYTS